jgi:hypothetical protein
MADQLDQGAAAQAAAKQTVERRPGGRRQLFRRLAAPRLEPRKDLSKRAPVGR